MKITFIILLALVAESSQVVSKCCLCEHCENITQETQDIKIASPFRSDEMAECKDIALELLEHFEEGSETCKAVQDAHQSTCCSSKFGELCTHM